MYTVTDETNSGSKVQSGPVLYQRLGVHLIFPRDCATVSDQRFAALGWRTSGPKRALRVPFGCQDIAAWRDQSSGTWCVGQRFCETEANVARTREIASQLFDAAPCYERMVPVMMQLPVRSLDSRVQPHRSPSRGETILAPPAWTGYVLELPVHCRITVTAFVDEAPTYIAEIIIGGRIGSAHSNRRNLYLSDCRRATPMLRYDDATTASLLAQTLFNFVDAAQPFGFVADPTLRLSHRPQVARVHSMGILRDAIEIHLPTPRGQERYLAWGHPPRLVQFEEPRERDELLHALRTAQQVA